MPIPVDESTNLGSQPHKLVESDSSADDIDYQELYIHVTPYKIEPAEKY